MFKFPEKNIKTRQDKSVCNPIAPMERQEAKNPGKFVGQLVHTERG